MPFIRSPTHARTHPPTALQELFFCEYDLCFFKQRHQMLRHLYKCRIQHPPGAEIYRNGNISMFEVSLDLLQVSVCRWGNGGAGVAHERWSVEGAQRGGGNGPAAAVAAVGGAEACLRACAMFMTQMP